MAKNKITIHRFEDPAAVGWDGWIEDEGRQWVLYFAGDHVSFYPDRDATGAVNGPPVTRTY